MFANKPGSRFITFVTNVPSPIVVVVVAHAVRLVKHSIMESESNAAPEKWSRFHNVLKPASSAAIPASRNSGQGAEP